MISFFDIVSWKFSPAGMPCSHSCLSLLTLVMRVLLLNPNLRFSYLISLMLAANVIARFLMLTSSVCCGS